jgi:hypothetical protein
MLAPSQILTKYTSQFMIYPSSDYTLVSLHTSKQLFAVEALPYHTVIDATQLIVRNIRGK